MRIGDEMAAANLVNDHIEQVCEESPYGTMTDILQVCRDREDLEDEHYLALTAADMDQLWDGIIGPAIDDVERSLRGDYD